MKRLLWLDDNRNPFLNLEDKLPDLKIDEIHWVKDYKEFVKWINMYGAPAAVSFDHDLAEEHYTPEYFWSDYEGSKNFQEWKRLSYEFETGEGCARYLVEYCEGNGIGLPEVFVHSGNMVGADWIVSRIKSYDKTTLLTNKTGSGIGPEPDVEKIKTADLRRSDLLHYKMLSEKVGHRVGSIELAINYYYDNFEHGGIAKRLEKSLWYGDVYSKIIVLLLSIIGFGLYIYRECIFNLMSNTI